MARKPFSKDPDAKLDYGFDWTTWLGTDTLVASSWEVDAGITVVSDGRDTHSTVIWVSGGTVGTTYNLTNHVETAAGRKDDRTLQITIEER